jgi:hypothetical protein
MRTEAIPYRTWAPCSNSTHTSAVATGTALKGYSGRSGSSHAKWAAAGGLWAMSLTLDWLVLLRRTVTDARAPGGSRARRPSPARARRSGRAAWRAPTFPTWCTPRQSAQPDSLPWQAQQPPGLRGRPAYLYRKGSATALYPPLRRTGSSRRGPRNGGHRRMQTACRKTSSARHRLPRWMPRRTGCSASPSTACPRHRGAPRIGARTRAAGSRKAAAVIWCNCDELFSVRFSLSCCAALVPVTPVVTNTERLARIAGSGACAMTREPRWSLRSLCRGIRAPAQFLCGDIRAGVCACLGVRRLTVSAPSRREAGISA